LSAEKLLEDIGPFGKPMVCAGGVGGPKEFARVLKLGYAGAQAGTRFIATRECKVPEAYKQAILDAEEKDIVLTEKISGVPVSVIKTPWIERSGTHAGPIARWMLRGRKTKHWMRTIYSLQSIWKLKRAAVDGMGHRDYFQAGKSVESIQAVLPAAEVVRRFAAALSSA
jgi:nitronate monooxygenase